MTFRILLLVFDKVQTALHSIWMSLLQRIQLRSSYKMTSHLPTFTCPLSHIYLSIATHSPDHCHTLTCPHVSPSSQWGMWLTMSHCHSIPEVTDLQMMKLFEDRLLKTKPGWIGSPRNKQYQRDCLDIVPWLVYPKFDSSGSVSLLSEQSSNLCFDWQRFNTYYRFIWASLPSETTGANDERGELVVQDQLIIVIVRVDWKREGSSSFQNIPRKNFVSAYRVNAWKQKYT